MFLELKCLHYAGDCYGKEFRACFESNSQFLFVLSNVFTLEIQLDGASLLVGCDTILLIQNFV